jgi:hypothetical protein
MRKEGVSGDGDPTLLVDFGDGATERMERPHALMEEEAKDVSLQRRDLFANDDLNVEFVRDCYLPRRLRRVNAIVIRDGDDVQPNLFGVREHL